VSGEPVTTNANIIFTNQNGVRYTSTISLSDTSNTLVGQMIGWLVERVEPDSGVNPVNQLLAFGTISFTNCTGSTAQTAANSFPSDGSALDMSNASGGVAATTAIDSVGIVIFLP
jgi:hypothetical protein